MVDRGELDAIAEKVNVLFADQVFDSVAEQHRLVKPES